MEAKRKIKRILEEEEERIQLAIQTVKDERVTSVREAASIFKVSRTTLQRRINGRLDKKASHQKCQKVSVLEEEIIVKWVISMSMRGSPPCPPVIRRMAKLILAERGEESTQIIGKNWVYRFIKRYKQVQNCLGESQEKGKAKSEELQSIRDWFNCVKCVKAQYGIHPDDVYNFDETAFAMDHISGNGVLIHAYIRTRRSMFRHSEREWVTAIECVNASGWVLNPYIVFKDTHTIFKDTHTLKDRSRSFSPDFQITTSEHGWTTDEIGILWLTNVFIEQTTNRTKGEYRLLILDGHGSHLTAEFDKLCHENKIIAICTPSHSSHLLQPLEAGSFTPLKESYNKLVSEYVGDTITTIDKFDFLNNYMEARKLAFNHTTITNSFCVTGLSPFDPGLILSKLAIPLLIPTSSIPVTTDCVSKPPSMDLKKKTALIDKYIQEYATGPSCPSDLFAKRNDQDVLVLARKLKERIKRRLEAQQKSERRVNSFTSLFTHGGGMPTKNLDCTYSNSLRGRRGEVHDSDDTTDSDIELADDTLVVCEKCEVSGHEKKECPNTITTLTFLLTS